MLVLYLILVLLCFHKVVIGADSLRLYHPMQKQLPFKTAVAVLLQATNYSTMGSNTEQRNDIKS